MIVAVQFFLASLALCANCRAESGSGPPEGLETTSFQTGSAYRPEYDVGADLVIIASNNKDAIRSWRQAGYPTAVMYGFRDSVAFCEGKVDGINRMEEVQTTRDGRKLDCGNTGYYMVPNKAKTERAVAWFREAVRNGAVAACPEEPEFWGMAGYSESFRKAFTDYYKRPWVDPESSPQARFDAEVLKTEMEQSMFAAIYRAAREENPEVRRFMLYHSPVSYAAWRIGFAHSWAVASGDVDEIIAQVWTGTARSPVPLNGQSAERTFLNAMLEYSSSKNLVRSSAKPLWFLMDPVEDNPDRAMDDYINNYRETLLAALMFPEVDRYELMPWPERIFGRVPPDYATVVHSVARTLESMRSHSGDVKRECGVEGVGVLMGQTTSWMNNPPDAAGVDGFYGLALPLTERGIPVEVLMAEQVNQGGYLDGIHTLLVSTEFMKPMSAEVQKSLLAWTRKGGLLLVFGGRNAYDQVKGWWHEAGYPSPLDSLLTEANCLIQGAAPEQSKKNGVPWKEVARADAPLRTLENLKDRRFDVTGHLNAERKVWLRFRDAWVDDGWGPYITSAAAMADGKTLFTFVPGTPGEAPCLVQSSGSLAGDGRRFADGQGYWIYEFAFPKGVTRAEVSIRIGNQYIVEAAGGQSMQGALKCAAGWPEAAISPGMGLTLWPVDAIRGNPFMTDKNGRYAAGWMASLDRGHVCYIGISPDFFAADTQGAELLRGLVKQAMTRAGGSVPAYRESDSYLVRRGPYLAVRALDSGTATRLKGEYVDLLDAALPLATEIAPRAGEGGLYLDLNKVSREKEPQIVFCTARVSGATLESNRLTFTVHGGLGTPQRVLLRRGSGIASVEGAGVVGKAVPVALREEGEYARLEVPGNPSGTRISAVVR